MLSSGFYSTCDTFVVNRWLIQLDKLSKMKLNYEMVKGIMVYKVDSVDDLSSPMYFPYPQKPMSSGSN